MVILWLRVPVLARGHVIVSVKILIVSVKIRGTERERQGQRHKCWRGGT